MWAVALGIAAFAVAAYELFTREPRAKAALQGAQQSSVTLAKSAARVAREQAARVQCGLSDSDLLATQKWVGEHFGPTVGVREGLAMMPNRRPPDTWPDFAQRTACYLARLDE